MCFRTVPVIKTWVNQDKGPIPGRPTSRTSVASAGRLLGTDRSLPFWIIFGFAEAPSLSGES